jgi:hypothetical protein
MRFSVCDPSAKECQSGRAVAALESGARRDGIPNHLYGSLACHSDCSLIGKGSSAGSVDSLSISQPIRGASMAVQGVGMAVLWYVTSALQRQPLGCSSVI